MNLQPFMVCGLERKPWAGVARQPQRDGGERIIFAANTFCGETLARLVFNLHLCVLLLCKKPQAHLLSNSCSALFDRGAELLQLCLNYLSDVENKRKAGRLWKSEAKEKVLKKWKKRFKV